MTLVAMPPEAEAKKSKKHNRGEFIHIPRKRFKPKPPINFGIPAPKGAAPDFGIPMPRGWR